MGLFKESDGQISNPDITLRPRNNNVEFLRWWMGCSVNGSCAQEPHVIIQFHELHQVPDKPFRRKDTSCPVFERDDDIKPPMNKHDALLFGKSLQGSLQREIGQGQSFLCLITGECVSSFA